MLYYILSEEYYKNMYESFFKNISDSSGDAGFYDLSMEFARVLSHNKSSVKLASFLRYIHIFLNEYYCILCNLKFMNSGTCLFEMLTLWKFEKIKEKIKGTVDLEVHSFDAHPKTLEVLLNLSSFVIHNI